METKILKILTSLTLIILFFSCDDFLEETPIDRISVDYIYTTPEGLELAVNALYNLQRANNVPDGQGDAFIGNVFFMVGTDLGHYRTFINFYHPDVHTPISNFGLSKWTIPYQIIDRANAIITSARDISMDQDKKNNLIAQARAIRGELYFDLIRMYDNILLDTIATTPENWDEPIDYEPADPADVFGLIVSDLDFAIDHLDWDVPTGRYGQGVVRHMRGQVAMWQEDWEEAVSQFDAIIESGKHSLLPDVENVFKGDRNHSETLYTYQRNEALGGDDNLAGGNLTYFSAVFNARTYELKSKEIIPSIEYGGLSFGWYYPNDYLQSLYDKTNDKRYKAYYYPEKLIVNNPGKPNYGESLPEESYQDNYRRYHFSVKKYHDEEKPATSYGGYVNVLYYRFAETLLLGAEAHWRLSGNGMDAKALGYLNRIRERAFGNSDHNFSEFTIETYLEESARELAFEKNRWFLLKRLGLLVERQNLYYTTGSNSRNQKNFPMEPHMVRLPIPQVQMDLMGTFPQNPGYTN